MLQFETGVRESLRNASYSPEDVYRILLSRSYNFLLDITMYLRLRSTHEARSHVDTLLDEPKSSKFGMRLAGQV